MVALHSGNQRSFMLRMAWLAAASPFRFPFLPLRFGVRMLRTRRQRRVLRRLAFDLTSQFPNLSFQLRDSAQQIANNRPGFRRLTSNQFIGDVRFHAHCCDTKPAFESRSVFLKKHYRAVNGYGLRVRIAWCRLPVCSVYSAHKKITAGIELRRLRNITQRASSQETRTKQTDSRPLSWGSAHEVSDMRESHEHFLILPTAYSGNR
ncbi:MAG: hypothetical protein HQ581_22515 [Planctomycetes bacterium]|nr:hypothetical protein [Planctomycetota bacterium]